LAVALAIFPGILGVMGIGHLVLRSRKLGLAFLSIGAVLSLFGLWPLLCLVATQGWPKYLDIISILSRPMAYPGFIVLLIHIILWLAQIGHLVRLVGRIKRLHPEMYG